MIDAGTLGEYRLVHSIGKGGMGEVFLGHDTLLDRPVAIKVIAARAPDATTRERFLIEARAIARLSHPNVVSVYRAAETEDGRPYLVQELLRGKSLDRLELPRPWREVRTIGLQIARGLAAAHRRGVLHRDIKPANAMLTDDGVVKLLDFGLAKLAGDTVAVARPPAVRERPPPGPVSGADVTASLPVPLAQASSGRDDEPDRPGASISITQPGAIMGTPRYLAPELWRGEMATERSDLYAVGAVLYELVTGRPVHPETDYETLRAAAVDRDPEPVRRIQPDIDPRLAALIDRCVCRDPASRPTSAEAIAHELDQAIAVAAAIPDGNPYRGLGAFQAEHRALFFGRGIDVSTIIDRLRGETALVIAGDSGVGKSSLCRAGVLPAIEAGALGDGRTWTTITMAPGRHPRAALDAALAALAPEPDDPVARVRRLTSADRGLLIFVDQAEELVTAGDEAEANGVAVALAAIAAVPGARVVLAARGDFLARLGSLPELPHLIGRGLHLLRPLDRDGLREAITGPVRETGITMSEALVDTLVDATMARSPTARSSAGGLPLLQFALTELWQRRDVATASISDETLDEIGGVAGALSRHADGVIAALGPEARTTARKILSRLVTPDDTSMERLAAEITREDPGGATIDALVDGRLIVGRDTPDGPAYHLAHDALIASWGTLRSWLDEDRGKRALLARLEAAAREWARLGRDALWSRRQLAEIGDIDVGPKEAAFIAASRRAARRRIAFVALAAAAVPIVVGTIYLGLRWQAQAARDRVVAGHVAEADVALASAHGLARELEATRRAAFSRFDAGDRDGGEQQWAIARDQAAQARKTYRSAAAALESALLVDGRPDLRQRMAAILYDEAILAERDHARDDQDDLLRRLAAYDDGTMLARWREPASLEVTIDPPARASLRCYTETAGTRILGPALVEVDGPRLVASVAPGSCVIEASAAGRVSVRAPIVLGRGERYATQLALPAATSAPRGFVRIPSGRFLYGASEETLRDELHAEPAHLVELPAFWIARTETTFGEWIEFLRTLPADERLARRPHTLGDFSGALELREQDGRWEFSLQRAGVTYAARAGEPVRYQGRTRRAVQTWERFPVAGISLDDALAYAAWLDTSGRVPGARLCSSREWERAGRGADDRTYPHGDVLGDDDTNHDTTYGRVPAAFGPDEVGSHPASDSPFGVADLAGNVWEWIAPVDQQASYRGGGWYNGTLSSLVVNREVGEPTMRDPLVGLRICTSVP